MVLMLLTVDFVDSTIKGRGLGRRGWIEGCI